MEYREGMDVREGNHMIHEKILHFTYSEVRIREKIPEWRSTLIFSLVALTYRLTYKQ